MFYLTPLEVHFKLHEKEVRRENSSFLLSTTEYHFHVKLLLYSSDKDKNKIH
jgi:hypothetical protein